MTTTFSGSSRLSNLRQKKNSLHQDPLNTQGQLKLTLPQQEEKTSGYEPSSTFSNTRTSMRLFKGKIDRGQSNDHQDIKSANTLETQPGTQQKLTLFQSKEDMKLVLHDSPQVTDKKAVQQQPAKPPQKRIMIQKMQSTEEPIKQPTKEPIKESTHSAHQTKQEEASKVKKVQPLKEQVKQQKPQYVNLHDEKPIKEEDVEQSKDQPENQNDLVMCPEGCGRKFNRKALQKHAKACKTVFMSKRKEFNTEAKRLTSKQQANLVKQNKIKEKNQFGKTKSKGFQKTSDNWKAASEDFRAAIKAVKKDEQGEQEENQAEGVDENQNEAALNLVACEFCQKMFAQVLIEKHLQNCAKKKQKEKQKEKDKKKTGAAVKKK